MGKSLNDIADLINFDFTGESRAEFGPVDDENWWTMFANVQENTTIYTKINIAHNDQYDMFDK